MSLPTLLAVPLAAGISAMLIVLTMPLMRRYALARPNARSSHDVPTPQGGGAAIIAGTLAATTLLLGLVGADSLVEAAILGAAVAALAVVGGIDDVRPLKPRWRLLIQALGVAAVLYAAGGRLVPDVPLLLERAVEIVAGVWFVNLVNFTDGLDWMTLASMVPISGMLLLLGLAGHYPVMPSLVAAALLGALLGFAPFNRPVAKLFMGDVGSLAIGLLVAWLLYRMALAGGLAAAVLPPLYVVADATLTLLWRIGRREKVWRAHRSHYYQVATDHGFTVPEIVGTVFVLNLALAVLATASLIWPSWPMILVALAAGSGLVGFVLQRFNRPRAGGKADERVTAS